MYKTKNPHALGKENIKKLLLSYSIPAVISMTLVSLYNVIDGIFIGHGVGPLAISGLAVTFPLMNLITAVSTLVGIGGATLTSIQLGKQDSEGASRILWNVLALCIFNGIMFSAISLIFIEPILTFFGASEETLPYAKEFMTVFVLGLPVTYVFLGLNNIMRTTGYPAKAMQSSFLTVGCNLITAPLFIFKFEWGMHGAAFATVISQFAGFVWVLSHFLDKKSFIRFDRTYLKVSWHFIKEICAIGMSPFLINVCASAIVIVINNSLEIHGGDLAVGAYGIVNRTLTLFVMVVIGLGLGMQPIIGYNFGARKLERVRKTLYYCILTAVITTTFGFVMIEVFPRSISALFTSDTELINLASEGLRITGLLFPLVGCQIIIGYFFQSIAMPKISIFLSLTRQLLYLLPFLLLLPRHMGITGVWASMPAADLLAFITAILTLIHHAKRSGDYSKAVLS